MLRILIIIILLCTTIPAYAKRNIIQEAPVAITIMCSSSLTNVMTEIIRIYSTKKAISITAIYDSPIELEYNIQSGDIADLYISEHTTTIRDLKRSGLLNVYSISDIAKNKLVMVASKKSRLSKISDKLLPTADVLHQITLRTLLHIGDPQSTWVGQVTKQALEKLQQWKTISPFVIRVGSVRNALYLIDKGESVGIIYNTDALTNKNVKILSKFDTSLHQPITYQAALVAGNNMKLAEGFLDFLKSDEAKSLFHKYGFIDLE